MNILLNLFGPSAAGKSTTTDLLIGRVPDLQIVDFDVVKRERIPNYDWKQHSQLGHDMTLEVLADTMSQGGPILLLVRVPRTEAEYGHIPLLAERYGYRVVNVEITAPKQVLIERYRERLANIDSSKKEWKFKTLEEFTAKLDEPYYRPLDTISFDTTQMAPIEVAEAIVDHVK